MSIICVIIIAWVSRFLVIRLAHAHCCRGLQRMIGVLDNFKTVLGRNFCQILLMPNINEQLLTNIWARVGSGRVDSGQSAGQPVTLFLFSF